MHLYVILFSLLLAVVAFGLFAAVALHGLAKDEAEAARMTSAISWVWFALAMVVGVTSMRSAATPGEYSAVKAAYVTVLVLIGANAAVQTEGLLASRVSRSVRRGAMWSAGMLTVILAAFATLRVTAWGRSSLMLTVVRNQFRESPTKDVDTAEDLLIRGGYRNRTMKRMLRSLQRSARVGRR
jgi:hypothetical protein